MWHRDGMQKFEPKGSPKREAERKIGLSRGFRLQQRLRSLVVGRRAISAGIGVSAVILIAVGLVGLNQPTDGYLMARHSIAVGEIVKESDFSEASANLGENSAGYLDSRQLARLSASHILIARSVLAKGSLVRSTDVSSAQSIHSSAVSVPLSVPPAANLQAGSRVDLWASTIQGKAESAIVALAATVVSISITGSSLGGAGKYLAELVVDDSEIPGVLSAIAQSQQLAIVATTGS